MARLTAYITVRDRATGRAIGRRGLLRIVTVEAPGIRSYAEVATHLGAPVLRVRESGAEWFRESYGRTLLALDSCGYRPDADLTLAAENAWHAR